MLILLADDHVVVRRGLRELFASTWRDATFLEVGTADEVILAVIQQPCSLLILDVNMPGRTGIDVLREVKRLRPRLPVLILSVQPEDQYAVRCLRAGASGYLSKDSSEEEILAAVKKVLAGKRYVSAQLGERLVHELQEPAITEPHALLSDREIEVLRLIASGKSLTEISELLHISVKTVSTYRGRCLTKMRLQSNADLVRYALQHELLPSG